MDRVFDRTWPETPNADPRSLQRVACDSCGLIWGIHEDLAGFRKQCECGTWMNVPPREGHGALIPAVTESLTTQRPVAEQEFLPAFQAEKVDPLKPMTLSQRADIPAVKRARSQDRLYLELAALVAAFLGPSMVALIVVDHDDLPLWLPFTSIGTAIMVLCIAAVTPHYGLGSFRKPGLKYFAEVGLALGGFYLLAMGLTALVDATGAETGTDPITERLGVGWSLFVIALMPGVFEEIAFRGVLQGRMTHLFGLRAGILYTAVAFTFAHGASLASILHFSIGLYLGWLRHRCGSLIPGMVLHALYNGSLVLTEAYS